MPSDFWWNRFSRYGGWLGLDRWTTLPHAERPYDLARGRQTGTAVRAARYPGSMVLSRGNGREGERGHDPAGRAREPGRHAAEGGRPDGGARHRRAAGRRGR